MYFEIERKRLIKMLDLVRDGGSCSQRSSVEETPYLRFAATADGLLTLTGLSVEASFPATVKRCGVLFLRVSMFRKVIAQLRRESIAVQLTESGLEFDEITLPVKGGDFEVYPDPNTAPMLHTADQKRVSLAREQAIIDARGRVENAKQAVIDAAQAMLNAERDLASLLGTQPDDRKVLSDLFNGLPRK